MEIIKFKDVSAQKDGHFLLKNLNLDINSGVMTVVLGPEDGGGRTMINLLAGFERQGVGDITIDGMDILTDSVSINRQTGYVLADSELYDTFTAIDNILFYAGLYGVDDKDAYERMSDLMRRLSLWKSRDWHYKDLSSSEKIKLRLVRALVHTPTLLIIDNVLKTLDNESLREVAELLKYLTAEENISVLMFTDNPQYSFGADDYVIIIDGTVKVSGSYEKVREYAGLKSKACLRTLDGKLNLPGYEVLSSDSGTFDIYINDKEEMCGIIKSAILFDNRITEARISDRSIIDIYSAILERNGNE